MNAKELLELDAWIAEHVMGWIYGNFNYCDKKTGAFIRCDLPKFSTDPAAALQVLEKCAEKVGDAVRITRAKKHSRNWLVSSSEFGLCFEAETLPAAIALFARQLFTLKIHGNRV